MCTSSQPSQNHSAMDSSPVRTSGLPGSFPIIAAVAVDYCKLSCVIHPRTVGNVIWTIVILAAIAVAAYFLIPIIGGWISGGMGARDTMGRPSSMDIKDNLPKK